MSTKSDQWKDKDQNHRVVITGTGVISPVGNNTQDFWDSLLCGKHNILPINKDLYPGTKVNLAAEVHDFEPMDYMDRKEARRMDRYCQFAVAAAKEAVESSGIHFEEMNPFDVGVIIGSGVGGLHTMHSQYEELLVKGGADRVSPLRATTPNKTTNAGVEHGVAKTPPRMPAKKAPKYPFLVLFPVRYADGMNS